MTKYDHRLKRLEAKSGFKEKKFNYWTVFPGKSKALLAKAIGGIRAGLIIGKMGSRLDPESQNMIIVSTIPRPTIRALRSREAFPGREIPDLTDDELEAEISSIQKELTK